MIVSTWHRRNCSVPVDADDDDDRVVVAGSTTLASGDRVIYVECKVCGNVRALIVDRD